MKTSRPNCLITIVLMFVALSVYSQKETNKKQKYIVKDLNEELAWKFKTNDAIYASPILKDEVLYVGSLDSNLYAIDVKTGEEKWKYKCSNKILSTALFYQNKVSFECGNKLITLDLDGNLEWEFVLSEDSVSNQIDPWDFHHSSPIIYMGILYIGTEKGIVFGIDTDSGKKVLELQTENQHTIRTTPIIYDKKLIFGDWDGVMYAYDLDTQKKIWQYDTKVDATYGWKNSIHGQPQIFKNSIIFAGRSSRVYSLDASSGDRNWVSKSPTDQWLVGGPVISDGTIYLGSSDQNLFQTIDAKSGQLKWQTKLDCRIWGNACIVDDKIYIGSNSMYEIDRKSGAIITQYTLKKVHEDKKYGEYIDRTANIHSSPILFKNKLIFGCDDGFVYAIELE